MSTSTIAMEPTQTPVTNEILAKAAEYWGLIVSLVVGLTAMIVFYRKVCKRRITAVRDWFVIFAEAPQTLQDLKKQLSFANGMTFQDWSAGVTNDLTGIRQMVAFETISRRNLWDTVKEPIFEANEGGKFRWANKAFLSMVEGNLTDVLDHNWKNMITGRDRDEVVDGWEMAVRDGADFKAKFRLATDSGEKWARLHAVCNKVDVDGREQVLGFTGKMWEIPDPRLAGGIHQTLD